MEMDVRVEGFDELIKALNALPGLLAERVQGDGLIAAAHVARDEARQTSEFSDKTGKLRASIRAGQRSQKVETSFGFKNVPSAAAMLTVGGPGARQAMLVEYGHGGPHPAPPHPYLEPAVVNNLARLFGVSAAAMRRSFAKLGRDLETGRTTRLTRRLLAEDT